MKCILYYLYATALFNCFIWFAMPGLFDMVWKFEIFLTLLFVPILYSDYKNDNPNKEVDVPQRSGDLMKGVWKQ